MSVPVPPHNLEAETCVLGAILLDSSGLDALAKFLAADDFYRENHRHVYSAALDLYRRAVPIDNVTLAAELERRGLLDQVGGRARLASLQEAVPTAANVEDYARLVKDCARRRRLIEAGREAIRLGQEQGTDSDQVLELAGRMQQAADGPESWEPPLPLAAGQELPQFPLECLPGWLAEYAWKLSEAAQTPSDLAGMLVLDALAACAGGRVWLGVRPPEWQEPLCLYTAVALPPGERKSGVFAEVTAPLAEFEAGLAAERSYQVATARARRKVAEKALEAAQNAAARASGQERERKLEEVDQAAQELEDAVVPAEYRLLADDATPEKLASLIAEQGGRIAVLSPEGGIFGQMAGRYSGSGGQPNLEVYLKGHAGDRLRVDRMGRGHEYVPRPALTIGLAVQPEVLRSLSQQPAFRGLGVLARFLYSLPTPRVGSRRTDVPPVPPGVRDAYAAELKALAHSLEGLPAPYLLTLSGGAEVALMDFAAELEPRLGEHGDLGHIGDWGSKLTGAVGRVAGLLHLAANVRRGWGAPVAVEWMEAAIALGRYFIPHALAAFDLMEADPNLALARRVLQWIADKDLREFSRRDCFNVFRRRVADRVEGLDPVLAILEVHGFLRRRSQAPRGRAGRAPSPVFAVTPLSAESALSAKSPPEPNSADSADSAPKVAAGHGPAAAAGAGWDRIA